MSPTKLQREVPWRQDILSFVSELWHTTFLAHVTSGLQRGQLTSANQAPPTSSLPSDPVIRPPPVLTLAFSHISVGNFTSGGIPSWATLSFKYQLWSSLELRVTLRGLTLKSVCRRWDSNQQPFNHSYCTITCWATGRLLLLVNDMSDACYDWFHVPEVAELHSSAPPHCYKLVRLTPRPWPRPVLWTPISASPAPQGSSLWLAENKHSLADFYLFGSCSNCLVWPFVLINAMS